MNVSFLIDNYFNGKDNVSIDVFDAQTLNNVYQDVMNTLTSHMEIETSVLQALSYCFYEILDNVHIHSGKPLGTAITHFDAETDTLRILVADDGKGMGFGLYATSRLVDKVGLKFILHSGNHKLICEKGATTIVDNGRWQGTILYMEIVTAQDIDPKLAELKRHTTFKGLNPMAERSVLVALQRRYKVIQESKQNSSQSN